MGFHIYGENKNTKNKIIVGKKEKKKKGRGGKANLWLAVAGGGAASNRTSEKWEKEGKKKKKRKNRKKSGGRLISGNLSLPIWVHCRRTQKILFILSLKEKKNPVSSSSSSIFGSSPLSSICEFVGICFFLLFLFPGLNLYVYWFGEKL